MADPQPKPVGCWRLLTLACALGLVAGAIALLAKGGTGNVAPRELLDPAFEVGALPFGFELQSATRLPFGFQIVHLRRPGAPLVEAEVAVPAAEATKTPAEDSTPAAKGEPKKARVEWRKLPIAPPGEPPQEAALMLFPGGHAQAQAWVDEGSGRSIGELEEFGGTVSVDIGKFRWDAFEPRYVHRRTFGFTSMTEAISAGFAAGKEQAAAGHPFSDAPPNVPARYSDNVRVDLSANGRAWALSVIWPKGVTGSKEQAFELARALRPKPPDAKPGKPEESSAAAKSDPR